MREPADPQLDERDYVILSRTDPADDEQEPFFVLRHTVEDDQEHTIPFSRILDCVSLEQLTRFENKQFAYEQEVEDALPPKARRGKPRKTPLVEKALGSDAQEENDSTSLNQSSDGLPIPSPMRVLVSGKKRGRPPKRPQFVETAESVSDDHESLDEVESSRKRLKIISDTGSDVSSHKSPVTNETPFFPRDTHRRRENPEIEFVSLPQVKKRPKKPQLSSANSSTQSLTDSALTHPSRVEVGGGGISESDTYSPGPLSVPPQGPLQQTRHTNATQEIADVSSAEDELSALHARFKAAPRPAKDSQFKSSPMAIRTTDGPQPLGDTSSDDSSTANEELSNTAEGRQQSLDLLDPSSQLVSKDSSDSLRATPARLESSSTTEDEDEDEDKNEDEDEDEDGDEEASTVPVMPDFPSSPEYNNRESSASSDEFTNVVIQRSEAAATKRRADRAMMPPASMMGMFEATPKTPAAPIPRPQAQNTFQDYTSNALPLHPESDLEEVRLVRCETSTTRSSSSNSHNKRRKSMTPLFPAGTIRSR